MIAYVHGTLLSKQEKSCVVLTPGGVGYELAISIKLAAALPAPGEKIELYVQTIVREDAIDLYGFPTQDERGAFAVLIGIDRLGPKTALTILSMYSPQELLTIAVTGDPSALERVSGIGKKSAQRIFLELKYRFEGKAAPAPLAGGAGAAAGIFLDSLAGLANLGYKDPEARAALAKVLENEPDLDVAGALRKALKFLAKQNS
ncbi:MAG: Holliday junction branch migration protein RuvA [Desulfovibrionaceae bacterium]|nr:Holliday junction branch migration protein RuvA [Desulfovibrionaceae bacterium]MBF0513271.1 Holliday junction branch migration protein RuvA [Desulfovibrionaceae bacterium]